MKHLIRGTADELFATTWCGAEDAVARDINAPKYYGRVATVLGVKKP